MKQKTKFFKIIAFAISFILLLTTFSTLSVATISANSTGSITITGVEKGVTVSIYQLTTVNVDSSGQPESPLYSWVNDTLKEWVNSNYSDYVDLEYFLNNDVADDSTTAQQFYNALAAAIKGGTLNLTATKSNVVGDTDTITFTGCAMGTYLILTTNGNMVYSPSVVNLVPEYSNNDWNLANQTVKIKASSIQITKTVTSGSTNNSFGTNETISYKIEADVPEYPTGSVSTNYYISDKMSDGLTLDYNSITVYGKIGETTVNLTNLNSENSYYTLSTEGDLKRPSDNSTSVDFLIKFVYENISSFEKIVVEYTATLNTDATIGKDGNTNEAYLDYSNDPSSANNITGKDSTKVTVYTYGIKVTKVDKSSEETTLPGAQFELQDKDGTAYSFVKDENGAYWLATEQEGTTTITTLEVDSNGELSIYGLAEGTYYLKETKAPAGYTKASNSQTIVIDSKDLETDGIYDLTFPNGTGFELPITGGIGTVIFTASGIVLICLGIVLFAFAMKKRKVNK